MNCNELKKTLNSNTIIIDVRDKKDFIDAHIPNSINIDHVQLVINPDAYLSINKKYYIICDKGMVSKNIVKLLSNTSYKLINIIDGFDNWTGPVTK